MIIQKPISWKYDPEDPRKTRLFFKDRRSADYYIVGSIAWPEGKNPGFALLSGEHLGEGRKIFLFEEQEFWTIDNWLLPDGNMKPLEYPSPQGWWYGLTHFVNEGLSKYGCRTYFYGGQHVEINQRHLRRFYDSQMAPRPVSLIEVPYVTEVGDNLISEYTKGQRYRGDTNSRLFDLLKQADIEENNGVHALKCLFSGYEHIPWMDLERKRAIYA